LFPSGLADRIQPFIDPSAREFGNLTKRALSRLTTLWTNHAPRVHPSGGLGEDEDSAAEAEEDTDEEEPGAEEPTNATKNKPMEARRLGERNPGTPATIAERKDTSHEIVEKAVDEVLPTEKRDKPKARCWAKLRTDQETDPPCMITSRRPEVPEYAKGRAQCAPGEDRCALPSPSVRITRCISIDNNGWEPRFNTRGRW
jgi:hypothetical protein